MTPATREVLAHTVDLILIRATVMCMVIGLAGASGAFHHAQHVSPHVIHGEVSGTLPGGAR